MNLTKLQGGKATHKDHNFDKEKGWYETSIQNVGFKNGHSVILGEEPQNLYGEKSCEGTSQFRKFNLIYCIQDGQIVQKIKPS